MRRLFIASLLFALVVAPAGALAQDGFDYFVGHWRCEGVFPKSGRSIASTLRFERDAGSGALLKHHDDLPPNGYHALEAWDVVKAGGFSDTVMIGGFGALAYASPGWDGDTLVWSSAPGASPAQRFTYVRLSPDRMRLDWSVAKPDGAYVVGDTLTCDRG